jgi:hypothetical protein
MSETSQPDSPADIVARAGAYYRNARYIICALALGLGLYFAYDGWIGYPNERDQYEHKTPSERAVAHEPHTLLDIQIQKELACALIPLAPILLAFFLYRCRGEYRLSGTTLHVPGHPPVPFDAIVGIDKSKWDRKGIVHIDYKLDDSAPTRRLTLDDFIYEQVATDAMVDALTAWLKSQGVVENDPAHDDEHPETDTPPDES